MDNSFPDPLRQQILVFPEVHMAVHRISVELSRRISRVRGPGRLGRLNHLRREGHDPVPFAVADVVAVYDG